MNINIKEFKDATFLLDEDDINDDLNYSDTILLVGRHKFEIFYKPILYSKNILIKPKKIYTNYEFERLFAFKQHCEDFNLNQLVKLIHK